MAFCALVHMITRKYIEHEIGSETHRHIENLKNVCFPKYQVSRSYFKQLPHFRFLTHEGSNLIGHLGVDHRMMTFDHQPHSVFGINDLCISTEYRRQGIGERMLAEAESLAKEHNIDCMVLLASDFRLYKRAGFIPINSVCQWLRIKEHTNYGIAVENIEDELMLKPLTKNLVVQGPIDFLGYMF